MSAAEPLFSQDLTAARRGDRQAFARVVGQHRNLVSTIALSIVRDVGTSEDVAQEVFVAAWQRLGELRNPASLLPWLRQITRNRARDALQLRQRLVPDEERVAATQDGRDLHRAVERSEEEQVLGECLEALSDDDREVVTLFYREDRSIRQVAQLLELSEDAVKKRLSRARERLRESVLARFGEAAEATRPGEGFTRAVLAALPVTATPGFLAGGAGLSGWVGKLLPLLGGAALGWASALFGIWTGVRSGQKKARDEQERAALTRYGWAASGAVTLFVTGFLFAIWLEAPRWVIPALWIAFAVSNLAMTWLWMPRITARRLAAELAEDPSAARKHRRDFWLCVAASAAAYTAGSIPIVLYVRGALG